MKYQLQLQLELNRNRPISWKDNQKQNLRHLDKMKTTLAASLRIETTEVGLKATTNEKIGDLGRSVGIAAHAVCMLIRKD